MSPAGSGGRTFQAEVQEHACVCEEQGRGCPHLDGVETLTGHRVPFT